MSGQPPPADETSPTSTRTRRRSSRRGTEPTGGRGDPVQRPRPPPRAARTERNADGGRRPAARRLARAQHPFAWIRSAAGLERNRSRKVTSSSCSATPPPPSRRAKRRGSTQRSKQLCSRSSTRTGWARSSAWFARARARTPRLRPSSTASAPARRWSSKPTSTPTARPTCRRRSGSSPQPVVGDGPDLARWQTRAVEWRHNRG